MTKIRKRKCKWCKEWFRPEKYGQDCCCPEHYKEYVIEKQTKQAMRYLEKQRSEAKKVEKRNRQIEAKAKREAKERVKTRNEWAKDAQYWFNKFIRLRDTGQPCISCQQFSNLGKGTHAGHYRSVGAAPELRFEEDNCHIQCYKCNTMLSGNVGEYRPHLIDKIGLDRVEWLEGKHEPKKYTKDDLKEIIKKYKAKCKELENLN